MAELLSAMDREFLEAENDLRTEFESQREEIKNRNSEEYNVLKIQLEVSFYNSGSVGGAVGGPQPQTRGNALRGARAWASLSWRARAGRRLHDALWSPTCSPIGWCCLCPPPAAQGLIEELERHFEGAHKAYLDTTEHRAADFKKLLKDDAKAAREIEWRMKKLVKMQEKLALWRTKIAANTREWEERNRALRSEKETMHKHYAALKSTMDAFRSGQTERLKQLAIQTTSTRNSLRKKLEVAQTILKLAEVGGDAQQA